MLVKTLRNANFASFTADLNLAYSEDWRLVGYSYSEGYHFAVLERRR